MTVGMRRRIICLRLNRKLVFRTSEAVQRVQHRCKLLILKGAKFSSAGFSNYTGQHWVYGPTVPAMHRIQVVPQRRYYVSTSVKCVDVVTTAVCWYVS